MWLLNFLTAAHSLTAHTHWHMPFVCCGLICFSCGHNYFALQSKYRNLNCASIFYNSYGISRSYYLTRCLLGRLILASRALSRFKVSAKLVLESILMLASRTSITTFRNPHTSSFAHSSQGS